MMSKKVIAAIENRDRKILQLINKVEALENEMLRLEIRLQRIECGFPNMR